MHKAGFVNIIGNPNVGKSTLMNKLVGERLSIITSKAQTTRHRIHGIVNADDYQVVFSDTPGVLQPHYKLHENMMQFVGEALRDADIILFVTDIFETSLNHPETLKRLQKTKVPVLLLLNKIDLGDQAKVESVANYWHEQLPNAEILPISALEAFNLEPIWKRVLELLPENPPYFDKEEMTDRPLRFFVSEMIREKIFLNYSKEIPYSTQVEVETYEEGERLDRIRAVIYVERKTQRGILIGHKGEKIKKVGIEARKEIEKFIGKQIHLELFVKVDENWRQNDKRLKAFGY